MPPSRTRTHPASSELGEGDFAVTFNKRTGRPIRKARRQDEGSPFVDSAIAVSDPLESDDSDGSTISVARRRKRKRSHSPLPSLASEDSEALSDANSESDEAVVHPSEVSTAHSTVQIIIKDMVIHVPSGHSGPILLQLDDIPPQVSKLHSESSISSRPFHAHSRPKATFSYSDGRNSRSKDQEYAGFLDIPAELRNQIYRHVFVAEDPLNFGSPSNFSRGAALLRTCRQAYEEGRSILYSENQFLFVRKARRHGSYWEKDWDELGFKVVRKFLRMIGAPNIALIRHATLSLEDATPCLNPNMHTADDRRFVYDDVLMSVLRALADHAKLQRLDLHLSGRRRVEHNDRRFLDNLTAIEADEVNFVKTPTTNVYSAESKQGSAVMKECLKVMVRKKKLYT